MISDENKKDLDRLLDDYNALPRYKKWFYPSALSTALIKYDKNALSPDSAFAVCNAFFNKTWFFQRWFILSLTYFSATSLVKSITVLNGTGLLTCEAAHANFNTVVGYQYACIARSLEELNDVGLLTGEAAQANFNAVMGHQDPLGVAVALIRLNDAGLLTGEAAQANRNAVAGHQKPEKVASALILLNRTGLLTGRAAQANRNTVAGHQKLKYLILAIETLKDAGLLTAETAQSVFVSVAITHAASMSCHIWGRIPSHRLTRAHFNEIIRICEWDREMERVFGQHVSVGRARFSAYVDREILHGIPQAGAPQTVALRTLPRQAFNPTQSTHTASVHETVSQSAKNLTALYGTKIAGNGLDKIIKNISKWLTAVRGNSLEIAAAKRCLPRITAPNYSFTDPLSKVSTGQLLAFAWIAIHDEKKRIGALNDAKNLLINGLYEIQRGDNISEAGVDNNQPNDLSICKPGTFNKIMEKLCGVHPEVKISFITLEGAGRKLKIVVNETAMAYLRGLANAPEGHQNLLELIAKIKEPKNQNSAEAIWDDIKDEVTNKMFDEFKSLWKNNKSSIDFWGFMSTGVDVLLSAANLTELETILRNASPRESAAVRCDQDRFFQATDSSVGSAADMGAPSEDSPKHNKLNTVGTTSA